MALHDDMLEQARHLATRERRRPRQASLRRAISAAYYALFHLLISEAVSKWKIADHRPKLARMFEHSRMNTASQRTRNVSTYPFTGQDPTVVANLRRIATAFNRLYDQRQMADYDLTVDWSRTDVLALIKAVDQAFLSMKAIRDTSIANDYLLSLFLKDR